MRCIQFHSGLLLPLRSHTQTKTQRQHLVPLRTRTKAMAMHNNAILLHITSPPKSGDISVLLQTGGVLLLAYGFSNFVVPILVSRYFGFDKVGEEEDDEDDLFKM